MKILPFRFQIALLSTTISGAVLFTFGVVTWLLVSRQKIESLDTELRSLGARHPGWIANRANYQRLDEALTFIFGESHRDQIILLVKDASGTLLHRSTGWPSDLEPTQLDCTLVDDPKATARAAPGYNGSDAGLGRGRGGPGRGLGPGGGPVVFTKVPRFQTVTTTNGVWRLGMMGTADITLVIGLNTAPIRAELDRLRAGFLAAMVMALGLVGVGGWLVAGRALRPIQAIGETAERVTASGLDARIPQAQDDPEIARVIHVLNRMMDRLEASFRQATRFSADASHELKTPLAIMQGELEAALQSAVPGSREQLLVTNLLEETQRLTAITRGLLLLAQADAGQLPLVRETLDLSAETAALVEDARVLAADAALAFEATLQPGLTVRTDRALLRGAMFNLLTNAIKYNHADGRIRVELSATDKQARFTVANTGPAIPAEDQARVFDRFYRIAGKADGQREGLGLGLSLAREILRAHGGEVALQPSPPGWITFVMTIPAPLD